MVKPISVEVIAPVPTDLGHYAHCEFIFGQTEVGQRVHGFVCLTIWSKWGIIDLRQGLLR